MIKSTIIYMIVLAFNCGLISAQEKPVNRQTQLFWGESLLDMPFEYYQARMTRNRMGRRVFWNYNVTDHPDLKMNSDLNSFGAAHYSTKTFQPKHIKKIELDKSGEGFNALGIRLGSNPLFFSADLVQQTSPISPILKNAAFLYGNFASDIGWLSRLKTSLLIAANEESANPEFKRNDRNSKYDVATAGKPLKNLYQSGSFLAVSNLNFNSYYTGLYNFRGWSLDHDNSTSLNRTLLNSNRLFINRQITDVSRLKFKFNRVFSVIDFGAEYLYRRTIETDSGIVINNLRLDDFSVFMNIEQTVSPDAKIDLRMRVNYSQLNGWFILPELSFTNLFEYWKFQILAKRFVNDDISVYDAVQPYLQGNRRLNLTMNKTVEKGSTLSFYLEKRRDKKFKSNFSLDGAMVHHQMKIEYRFDKANNSLSQVRFNDYEFLGRVKLNLPILHKEKIRMDLYNHYRFQSFRKERNGLEKSKHAIFNEIDLYVLSKKKSMWFNKRLIELKISQTSRFGVHNGFYQQGQTQFLVLDAGVEFYLGALRRQLFGNNDFKYNVYTDPFSLGFKCYDLFSKTVRGNFNEGMPGFIGSTLPISHYRYGISLKWSL